MPIPSLIRCKSRLNVKPTNEEESRVRRAMSEPFNRLSTVESEIARLRDRLVVLGQKKKDTEHFIKVHQGLFSPIRRLHPDILQEIFCRCLSTAHNSVLSPKEAPLLLGQVCSHWRQVAYSTPALWSSLHINTTPFTSPGSRARFKAVDAWLNRSGILPLSISMYTIQMNCDTKDTFLQDFRSYFNLTARHVRRWKYVYIEIKPSDPTDLFPEIEINPDDLPLLEVFSIRTESANARSLLKKNSILMAPSLHVVSVHEPLLPLLDLPVQWGKLTGLDLASSMLSDVFILLSLCSNLETCALTVGSPYNQPFSTIEEFGHRIVLPQLKTLNICGVQFSYNNDLSIILNKLLAPALRHFVCRVAYLPSSPSSGLPLLDHSSLKHFRSFFQVLNEPLEELDFYDHGNEASYLMEILHLCPGLKRLSWRSSFFISGPPEGLYSNSLLLKFIPYGHKNNCQSCSIVKEFGRGEEVEVDSSDLTSSTCLCPNLEVLRLYGAYFSRHVLLEFLKSRLVDYDKYGVVRLRRFSIAFNSKWDNEDMKRDTDLLAETSGSLVKLEHAPLAPLIFGPPLSLRRDPFIEELPGF